METITLPDGRIILPLEICRRLGIEAGMRLEVDFDDNTGCIRLRPLNYKYINASQRERGENNERKSRSKKKLKT